MLFHPRYAIPTVKTPTFLGGDVLLCHTDSTNMDGPKPALITQFGSFSPFNHSATLIDSKMAAEAVVPKVQVIPVAEIINRYEYVEQWRPICFTDEMRERGRQFIEQLMKDPPDYDLPQLIRIGFERAILGVLIAGKCFFLRITPLLKLWCKEEYKKVADEFFKTSDEKYICSELSYSYYTGSSSHAMQVRNWLGIPREMGRNKVIPAHFARSPQFKPIARIWKSTYHPEG